MRFSGVLHLRGAGGGHFPGASEGLDAARMPSPPHAAALALVIHLETAEIGVPVKNKEPRARPDRLPACNGVVSASLPLAGAFDGLLRSRVS